MLIAWYGSKRVGRLSSEARQISFQYDAGWVTDADAFPLSPRIPLDSAPVSGDEPLYFFSNLLPEGPLLRALCKLKRLPEGNVYAQLEAFGAEAAGAFALLPENEIPSQDKWRYIPYTEQQLSDDLNAMRRGHVPLLGRHGELRLSLAGAQDKLPVHYKEGELSLPSGGAPSTHILKPNIQPTSEYPQSVENELLCLGLAGEAGLPAVKAQILDKCEEKLLLIERFDRELTERGWRRLHQLDFCQLAGVLPDQKYEKDGGPGFRRIFALIMELSALPAGDRLAALDWTLYNFLIGNADAHAKNLAMIPSETRHYRLAPWYDLLATGYYPRITERLAAKIGGEDRPEWIRAHNWRRFAEETGINSALLRKRAAELAAKLLAGLSAAASSAALTEDDALVRHLRKTIERRARWSERASASI